MMQRLGKTKAKNKVPQTGPKKPKNNQPRPTPASAPFAGDMSEHPSVILRKGLGTLQVLGDHDVIVIFRELSVKDLLTLNTVSKAWHQFCNWDELWRLLCFDLWEGDFIYKYSWKLTTLFPHVDYRAIRPELITPKRVDGFYSDYMYRKWYRSTQIDYTNFERDTEDIERIDVTGLDGEEIALTLAQFREQYDKPFPSHGVPVILNGIVENWPAMSDPTRAWTPDNLAERFKDHLFKIGEHNRHKKRVWMTMRDYLTYMRGQRDDKPIYLFDDGFAERVPELLKDYSIPEYFIEDLYAAMGDHRPPFRWVIMGPARSGTPFHIDPHGTSAWNALLYGRKRWALYPPHISPPGLNTETDAQGNILDMSSAYPTRFYHQMFAHMNEEHKPIEFVQEAGDMVFIPGGWWHQVLNLTETVSVTQNIVNTSNLKWVVQSMCQHQEFEALSYWRDKILPLRPEVYKTIYKQMDWMHGRDAINKVEQLKDKKKQLQQREEEYKQEIERLKNELAKLGSGAQANGVPNGVHKDV